MQQSTATRPLTQRRITLIRHAKAETGDSIDLERALEPRGLSDAKALGDWLKATQALPELFLCSTARRTRQTLEAFSAVVPTILSDRLYLASSGEMLKYIAETDDAVMHLGILGHNPGMHQLAAMMAGDFASEEDAERLTLKFPTSACAVITLTLDHWCDIAARSGRLTTFVIKPTAALVG